MILRVVYSYIDTTLTNFRGVIIFCDIYFEGWAIWLCIYCKKVRDVQHTIFIMVVSSQPFRFSAIAPPAQRECAPTKSGLMDWGFNLIFFDLARTSDIMWWLSNGIQSPSLATKHNRLDSSSWASKISYMMWAKASTEYIVMPVSCCVMVWPIWPFFWFEFFSTAKSAVRSTSIG